TPTLVAASPATNWLLALGAVLIVVLVVAVLVLALRDPTAPVTANLPTESPTTTAPTSAPTAVAAAPATGPRPVGRVSFSNGAAPGDTANVQVGDLAQPASGSIYVVWLT